MNIQPENSPKPQAPVVRREELGQLIRAKRKKERLTLEIAAHQCGVSSATLWRLEQQITTSVEPKRRLPEPDTGTLGAVTQWLGVSLGRVLDTTLSDGVAGMTGGNTPDVIEAHLRADRNLDPQAAAALGRMFRLAYKEFQKRDSQEEI